MVAHAKLSASGSHRWLHCPGSVRAEENEPQSQSFFADEGTAAHELGEIVLTEGGTCFDWVGEKLIENNAFTVTQDMAEYVQQYVDYIKQFSGEHFYEERVDFSEWVPDGFGTADALVIDGNHLHVIDLKYGKGVMVNPHENTQGLLYALGALSDYGFAYPIDTVTIHIVQPRLDHISGWTISSDEVLKRGEWISQRAELALSEAPERVPGEKQCQWCRAKVHCRALITLTHEVIATDFDNMDALSNPDTLDDAQLRKAMENKKLITSWFDAVEKHAFEKLEKGESFPGFKLVEGRSNRAWGNVTEAEQLLIEKLGDKAYEKSLLSVAKAEKALGKKDAPAIAELIVKPKGKPAIVPESDPRPAIGATIDDFDDCNS